MASRSDIARAQRIFVGRLDVEPTVALRIFGQLQVIYRAQIAEAQRGERLYTAEWAANRLQSQSDTITLSTIDSAQLRAALANGCPLCASRGSGTPVTRRGTSGSGSRGGTPVQA